MPLTGIGNYTTAVYWLRTETCVDFNGRPAGPPFLVTSPRLGVCASFWRFVRLAQSGKFQLLLCSVEALPRAEFGNSDDPLCYYPSLPVSAAQR